MKSLHAGRTDTGRRRQNNEDAWLAAPEQGLFVVCDGVGGRARGELASHLTTAHISDWIEQERPLIEDARDEVRAGGSIAEATLARLRRLVRSAIQNAGYMVHGMGELDPARRGMSTTTSLLLVVGRTGLLGHVGDSRVYRWRAGACMQLTEDHTLVQTQIKAGIMTPEQARSSGFKNLITRAVGLKEWVEVDVTAIDLRPGDRFLLCTDGLHDYLDNGLDIDGLFARELEDAAETAISAANHRGGQDNITALFVELTELV
jgi:protein phosphatase